MAGKYNEKISMRFNNYQLDKIIIALLNNSFNKKFVSNVKQLINAFEPQSYINDATKDTRVHIIKVLVETILEKNINEKNELLNSLDFDGKYNVDATDILNNLYEVEMTDEELRNLDELVSEQLKYKALDEHADELIELFTNLKSENYDSKSEMIRQIEESINVANKDLKAARESLEDTKKDMNLSSNSFIGVLDKMIKEERNPSARVKTGIQYLNAMLGGGFSKSRLYLACGMAKGGKSAFLLACAIWAKLYNTFVLKDPEKKPVIVYLTMENTTEETIGRIWNYCFGDSCEMKTYEKAEAAAMLEKANIFTPNNPMAPELQIWYRANRSINAMDIAGMLDELERQGKECVFLVVDYLARMKAVEYNKEQRLELSNITNDLKVLAADYDIPVLSAHQLNREAFNLVDSADTFEEKRAASNKLGVSQIGDSIDVVRNCDFAFIVNRLQHRTMGESGDFDQVDNYIFIKSIASRMKQPPITSFQHRFKAGNGMAMIDDIFSPYPQSIKTDVEMAKDTAGGKTKGGRTIVQN